MNILKSLSNLMTATKPGRWESMAKGIDCSRHAGTINWAAMKGKVDFAIIKCGEGENWRDPLFADNVQGAHDHDIPAGAYFFHDPVPYMKAPIGQLKERIPVEADPQLNNLKRVLQNKKIYFIAIDIEKWWVDYDEYYEYLAGKRPASQVRKITAQWQYQTASLFCYRVQDAFPHLPILIYTGEWFVKQYGPDLPIIIQDFPLWSAYYTLARKTFETWQEAMKNLPPEDKNPPTISRPTWEIWQYAGDMVVKEFSPSKIDLNIWQKSPKALWEYLKFTPKAETPQPPPQDGTGGPTLADFEALKGRLAKLEAWAGSFE